MNHRRRRDWSAYRLGPETLEVRRVPAQFGVPWHDAKHLSISFVPDGTQIASHQSDLFQTLDALEPTADWQHEILRAFQTWAVQAHVNFDVTTDGGQPLGTPGPDQHDPRFGDIRIGAVPMSSEVLSISVPHDPFLSGTWSGDVLLNSASLSGKTSNLFPILLHEVGHVLGLDHSDDPNSVMFSHLHNTKDGLAPSDVAAVQALYGPRPGDTFEGPTGNNTPETAAAVPTPARYDGSTPLLLYADISKLGETDFFSWKAPTGYRGPATVRLQTAGVSLLAPHLTVLDASGRAIADLASGSGVGDTLEVTLPLVEPGAAYTVEVRGATDDVFGIGEYALAVSFDARSTVSRSALDTLARQSYSYLSPDDIKSIFINPSSALFSPDNHVDDTFATALPLDPVGAYGSEAPDRITASLGASTDVDVYRIETPKATNAKSAYGGVVVSNRPLVMTVSGRATEVNGIMPQVEVFDADKKPVPSLVLAHGDGTYTVQVADARPDAVYFIQVNSDPTSGKVVGNYELDVEFGHDAAAPVTFVESTLGGTDVQRSYDLVVNQTQLFDFLLAATSDLAPQGSDLRMTVVDSAGRTVGVRTAGVDATSGGDPLVLVPGIYRVSFTAESARTGPPPSFAFRLYGASLTDPIGPALDDPTYKPVASPTSTDSSVVALPAVGSSGDPYTWLAVTLASPERQAGSTTVFAARADSIRHESTDTRNAATLANPQDGAILPPSILSGMGGARSDLIAIHDSALAALVAGRPNQSQFSRNVLRPGQPIPTSEPAPGGNDLGLFGLSVQNFLLPSQPMGSTLPPVEIGAFGPPVDPSRPGQRDSGEGQLQVMHGPEPAPPAQGLETATEAQFRISLRPAVVILGVSLVALAYTQHCVTSRETRPTFRWLGFGRSTRRDLTTSRAN